MYYSNLGKQCLRHGLQSADLEALSADVLDFVMHSALNNGTYLSALKGHMCSGSILSPLFPAISQAEFMNSSFLSSFWL